MSMTEHIRSLIQNVPEETPFFLSDVVDDVATEFHIERLAARNLVQQELKKMMDVDALVRCFRGVYCKPAKQGCPPFDIGAAISLYCHDLEGRRIGYPRDHLARLFEYLDGNSQNIIVTNRYKGGPQPALAKEFGLTLIRPKTLVNEGNFEYLALLDGLGSMPQEKDQLSFVAKQVSDYLEEQGLSFAELLGYASRLYPPDVVLLVASLCEASTHR